MDAFCFNNESISEIFIATLQDAYTEELE